MSQKNKTKKKGRRRFLKTSGLILGGTLVGLYLGKTPIRRFVYNTASEIDLPSGIVNFKPEFWFEVKEDNTIELRSPKVEMGQGIFTGYAMLAAEELNVPIEQIKVVPGSTTTAASDFSGTGGSNSTYPLYKPLRKTAATLREMLKNAAAEKWGVAANEIKAEEGFLITGNKKMSYAEVVALNPKWDVPDDVKLKPSSEFKYIGTDVKRVDLKEKVMGTPIFGIDAELPDMLYATIVESPYIEGKLKSLDDSDAKAIAGVLKVINEEGLIAVVGENRYAAEMGKRMLNIEWDVPKKWQQSELEEMVTVGNGNKVSLQKKGSAKSILKDAGESLFSSEYRTPFGVHAHTEPNGVVASVADGKATIIMGTQVPEVVKMDVSGAVGISRGNVEVQTCYLGGGFGRRWFKHNAVEAARISKIMGKPIHAFNDREGEFQNGYFRPITHHQFQAKIENGKVEAISHDLSTGDMVATNMPVPGLPTLLGGDLIAASHGAKFMYGFENKMATMWQQYLPFQTGIWRAVGMIANTFAIESFMDELAHKTDQDPLAFRIAHLQDSKEIIQRMKTCLEAVRDKSGWNKGKQAGIGRGVAIGNDRNTPCAAVIDVHQADGQIRVKKVTIAIDPGLAINPEGIRMQVEGSVMMGLSAALYEEVVVKDGLFSATNFHQYPMATLKDTPEIEVIILEGTDEKPYGVGEPPMAPIAPAIANAIFDLTGERKRKMPLLSKTV